MDAERTLLTDELLRRVMHIEIAMQKRVDQLLSGAYKSRYKGTGMQFAEHRPYVPGDDVRHLDWKVSARTREPLIKQYEEERERQVFVVADLSKSQTFGSSEKLKKDVLAELSALVAMAASRTGDKTGLVAFAHEATKILRPKRGRQQVLRIIRELLAFEADRGETTLSQALDTTERILKHAGVVIVMSDFLAKDAEISLRRLQRRHDVLAVWIRDPLEQPKYLAQNLKGLWQVHDPESPEPLAPNIWWSSQNTRTVAEYEASWTLQQDRIRSMLKRTRVEVIEVTPQENYVDRLVGFFQRRKLGRARR